MMNPESIIPSKKKRRIDKQNRRRHPEISREIIIIWEELRQKNVKLERKQELCDKIMSLSKSVLNELVRQKATARVFESVIEFGNDEHRWTIFEIIKPDLLELCKGKYSYFAINNMLKYGTKEQRLSVFELLNGHIVDLLPHAHASKVVEAAYNEFANSKQRSQMIQEFYGKIFALFTNSNGAKPAEIKHLAEFTSSSSYDRSILANLHKILQPILHKQHIDLTIVQHVLAEYLAVLVASKSAASANSQADSDALDEIIEATHEQILKLCNTREGTKVAITLFQQSPPKIRKKIVQGCKDSLIDLCCHADAHLLVLAMLDQTDDTKMLWKSLIRPIVEERIDEIAANTHGRKILQFLLVGRDAGVFGKFVLEILRAGDASEHTKKDANTRAAEIVEYVTTPLLKWLAIKIDECLRYTGSINVAKAILMKCIPKKEDDRPVYRAILASIAAQLDAPIFGDDAPSLKRKAKTEESRKAKKKAKQMFTGQYKTEEPENQESEQQQQQPEDQTLIETNILESIGGNRLVKAICKLERESVIEGFSELCLEHISLDSFKGFVSGNRTAFFIVFLFEIGNAEVQQFIRTNLDKLKGSIAKSQLPAVKILHKLLCSE